MKVGITGGEGFVGWHLDVYLKTITSVTEIEIANRDTFDDVETLKKFVSNKDVIFHLAGVNRANSDQEILHGNEEPANKLVKALNEANVTPDVIYTSTTHAIEKTSIYGKAKAAASDILYKWSCQSNARFVNVIVPHVFGEYCKPFYNSAVGTFCYQIANGEQPSIVGNGQLKLLHAQHLAEKLYQLAVESTEIGDIFLQGNCITVIDVASKLNTMFSAYLSGIIPDISNQFDLELFNSLRAAIPMEKRLVKPSLHTDERGWLVEAVKVSSGGQSFVSSTKSGITRGNHYHRKKFERFFILQGAALIKMRKIGTTEVFEYKIDGEQPAFLDIPTLFTHNITNIGQSELVTLFWTNEIYDPANPDTYFEVV